PTPPRRRAIPAPLHRPVDASPPASPRLLRRPHLGRCRTPPESRSQLDEPQVGGRHEGADVPRIVTEDAAVPLDPGVCLQIALLEAHADVDLPSLEAVPAEHALQRHRADQALRAEDAVAGRAGQGPDDAGDRVELSPVERTAGGT